MGFISLYPNGRDHFQPIVAMPELAMPASLFTSAIALAGALIWTTHLKCNADLRVEECERRASEEERRARVLAARRSVLQKLVECGNGLSTTDAQRLFESIQEDLKWVY